MAACSGRLVEGDETSADPAGNPDAGAAGPAGDPDAGTADPPAGPNPPAPAVDTGRLAPDVRRALANLPAAEVVAEGHQGLAAFVRGNLGKVAVSTAGVLDRDLKQALEPIAPVFRLDAVDLHATKISVDELGQTHVRLRQTRNGLDVIGGDLRLHIDKDGTIAVVNGTAHGVIDGPPPVPTVAPADATVAALAFSGNGSLSAYPPSLTYAIVNSTGELHLTWDVRVEGVNGRGVLLDTRVLVDAHTGQVVDNLPLLLSGRSRTLSTADGTDAIPGRFLFGESGPLDYSNLPANDNHWWLGNVYDAYRAIYGRDSYDFAGATLDSTIDYVTTAGVRNNAFWHGMYHRLLFGPGDGVNYGNFAASGDVVAHEFTHAVTGSESALTYAGESGALNEAMSDMFAAILAEYNRGYIDQGTFWIAEDIHQPNEPGEHAMRYMDDPTRDGYSRDHYATRREPGFCLPDEQNDWCGVHGNSGIANLAFYLMVVGGNRSGVTVTGVGMAKARQIVYRANTRYLTSSATFTTMRAACLQASRDLYDATTAERVGRAWDAVGVWSAEPNDNFSAATNIASLPFTIFGNTYHASQEEGEAGFGSSVWFKWTPTRSGTVGFNLIADGVTPLLYVMTGTKLDYSLNTVTKSDPRVNVVAGSTYRIQIHNEPWETTGFRFEGDYVQDAIVYVSDLSWKSATNGFGPVERDRSNGQAAAGDGKVLTLGGTTYSKGLGVHGASDVRFDLAGKYARFLASVGVDDEVGASGSVVFQVWADSVKLYDSGTMTGNAATKNIDVNVAGRNELRLVVTDGGNGNGSDHADWANARLAPSSVSDVQSPTPRPGNLSTQQIGSSIQLSWDESTDSGSSPLYQIMLGSTHIATSPGPWDWIEGLTPGTTYTFTVRAVDQAGNISAPSAPVTVTTQGTVQPPPAGLVAQYYAGINFDGSPIISRVDGNVNFDWGTGSPSSGVPADQFSSRWTGFVTPAYTQTYTFYARTNDGARLFVDGRLLVDKWVSQGLTEWSATINLEANRRYELRMEAFEGTGSALAQLSWSSASQTKQIIPANRLSH